MKISELVRTNCSHVSVNRQKWDLMNQRLEQKHVELS